MVRLGTIIPFEQVPAFLAFLLGVHVSAETVRRQTETAGAAQVTRETKALEHLERTLPPPPVGPSCQQLSADGAMVPVLGGEWAEVRTVAIGTLDPGSARGVHATDLRYFARLCSAAEFIRQAALPLHERGIAGAKTVVAVMDGADWLQQFIDGHRPDAVRILDFPHAAEYLARAAQAAYGSGTSQTSAWLEVWLHELKHGTPAKVLAAVRALPVATPETAAIRDLSAGYLQKRHAQLQYAQFRAQGYPIGSGLVESANKLVVEARLNGSGMHWKRSNVTPMVALRGLYCSGRWEVAWPAIEQELRDQCRARRRHRRRERRQQRDAQQSVITPPTPQPILPQSPPQMLDGRPTEHHVWRAAWHAQREVVPKT